MIPPVPPERKISRDSLLVKRQANQLGESGSIPTSPLYLRVKECKFKDIRHIFEGYHYKGGHMGGGISLCLGACYKSKYLAGVVVGPPRQNKKYSSKCECVEIRRMACVDELPKNSESWLLAKTIWWLKKHTDVGRVISYSDQSVGHKGVIYKAANFKLIGETAPSKHVFWKGKRYHPRSLTIDRPYSYKMREGLKTGETIIETGAPKLIFEYLIKRRN